MSCYLVTGCAGFIGSHVTEALLGGGHDIVGVDSFTDYYRRELKERNLADSREQSGFTFIEADLAVAELGPLLDDVDGIFHLAAQPGVRGSWGSSFPIYARENILVTQRVFEEAARRGQRVIFASSSSVYGNAETYPTSEVEPARPISPYGVTKLSCEHLAEAYAASADLDYIALRYFTVFGPRQRPDMAFARVVDALVGGSVFSVLGTGDQTRDFTYVADAVRATLLAFDDGESGGVYNVGGAEASLREAITIAERLAGRQLEVSFDRAAVGDVRRTKADTTCIRSQLGWAPETSLEAGLAAQIDHFVVYA